MFISSRGKHSAVFLVGIICAVVAYIFVQTVFASSTGTLLPKADGNYTQWTPSTGTSHFVLVDETACNGTTDYNRTTTVGNRDSYVVSTSSIPNGATITQIDIKPCASRDGTLIGTSVLNVFYRFGGIDSADQGSYSFTSGNTPSDQATTSFSGLLLLQTSTTTLEVGAIYTSGTKGLRISRIVSMVTYSPLLAPTSLAALATTTSTIKLTWLDNASNESGFAIERNISSSSWSGFATTSADTTSFYDVGLSTSTFYSYRVRAFNSGAYTSYSNIASATTTNDNPPFTPSDLSLATSTGVGTSTDITLSWTDNSSNESGFKIERKINTGSFVQIATTTADIVSYPDLSHSTGTYTYRIRAYNAVGMSSYSNTATTTIP